VLAKSMRDVAQKFRKAGHLQQAERFERKAAEYEGKGEEGPGATSTQAETLGCRRASNALEERHGSCPQIPYRCGRAWTLRREVACCYGPAPGDACSVDLKRSTVDRRQKKAPRGSHPQVPGVSTQRGNSRESDLEPESLP
jgi:hypothetical protein